ncbi:MAG: prefoldin subunit beta [Desulfurococcaceae archaeon]
MSEKTLPPEVQQLIIQYQTLREHYSRLEAELRVVEAELGEINNVMDTLKTLDEGAELYKATGHILVRRSKNDIVKELEERRELLSLKKDKYKKQLDFLSKQINDLENRLREALTKQGITVAR